MQGVGGEQDAAQAQLFDHLLGSGDLVALRAGCEWKNGVKWTAFC